MSFWKNTRTWWCAHVAATDTGDMYPPAQPLHRRHTDKCVQGLTKWNKTSAMNKCKTMSQQWIQVCCFSSSHTQPFPIRHFRSFKLPRGCTSESTVWTENEPDVYILKQRHKENVNYELKCSYQIFKGVTSYIIYNIFIFWGPLKMLQKLHQKSQISCSNTIFHGLVAPWN